MFDWLLAIVFAKTATWLTLLDFELLFHNCFNITSACMWAVGGGGGGRVGSQRQVIPFIGTQAVVLCLQQVTKQAQHTG